MKYVVLLALLACHRETKMDARVDAQEQDHSAKTAEESRTETEEQAPTEVKTTTTKSDNAVIVQDADGSSSVVVVSRDKPLALQRGAKVIGTVPVAQVVVEQDRSIGAVVVTKNGAKKSTEYTDAKVATTTAVHTKEERDIGFSTKFYLLAGGALLAVVGLGIFLSRSKLVRRLLGVPV